ncbi:DUF2516 family protein [Arthrobacter sp. NPDC090010]|uniref:DUF2516 family protein n=1 Tax=Arthrobacter sp. NPDC090010 TaxID=3363942 RepID=UPI0037FD601B
MSGKLLIYFVTNAVYLIMGLVAFGLEAWAFIDALSRKGGDYDAAMKRSKTFWLALTGGAALVGLLSLLSGAGGLGLFGLAAVIAACVYLADVRPAIKDLRSGGYNSW